MAAVVSDASALSVPVLEARRASIQFGGLKALS